MPVKFRLILGSSRQTVIVSGLAGLAAVILLFSIPFLFAAALDAERAKHWILYYLKKEAAQQHSRELQSSGLNLPTQEMAERWKAEMDEISQIEFLSLDIKKFIFVPTLITSSRMYAVRVDLQRPNRKSETRYFSLSAKNNLFDFFWVTEQSRWMWFFSIG